MNGSKSQRGEIQEKKQEAKMNGMKIEKESMQGEILEEK